MVTLTTDRLILRPFQESDLDPYAAIFADAEVMRFISGGQPTERADAWKSMAMHLGHWQLRGYGRWGVELRATGEFIGRIGLYNPEGWPGIEVGWMLGRKWWGQGLATEGAEATLNYAFRELKVPHVCSVIDPNNLSSIRVAKRLGETLRRETLLHGQKVFVYGIDKEEWESRQNASRDDD